MNYAHYLQNLVATVVVDLRQIEEFVFQHKPDVTTWSKKEILGHLIDSAYNNQQRFVRAEAQGDLIFLGYDQEAWVVRQGYQSRPAKEIVEIWYRANLHLAALIANLPASLLSRTTTEHNFHKIGMNRPEQGKAASLAYLVWDYIFHLEHHLAQILPDFERSLPYFVEK